MKRIMILGASRLQVPLIMKAKERGLFVIVASPSKDEIGKQYADLSIESDVRDQEYILRQARELKIDGIITDQTDIPVRTVAYVAEKMGLPGIGYDVACLFTDKYKMREKCKELGIKTLRYKMCGDIEDAISFFQELNYKAIVKPIDNQGSRGVTLVTSQTELREAFLEAIKYSAQKKVLIEEVAHGREFVVEGLAYQYGFQNLIVGDTYYFDLPNVFSAYERAFPTDADDILRERVEELNKKIITGFGLKQGITHSEYILNGNDIILIETAARGGGVYISSDLISISTGLCTEDFLLDISLGETWKEQKEFECRKASCYVAFFLPEGIISSVEGISAVRELKFAHHDNFDAIRIGNRIGAAADKTSRFHISIEANNREELKERAEIVRGLLNGIKVTTDRRTQESPIWR